MQSLARGLSLFLGTFALLNLVADVIHPNYAANLWWINLSLLPPLVQQLILLVAAVAMLDFALASRRAHSWTRVVVPIAVLPLLAASVVNAIDFYVLLFTGKLTSAFPLPFSLFVTAALLLIVRASRRGDASSGLWVAVTFACAAVAFPLLQILCFGLTDYRRHADVAIVLGARAYADGTPSRPLMQRTVTAAELFRQGLVPSLVLSGGPGDGLIDEPEAMARVLEQAGVPRSALMKDPAGVNTEATVTNTLRAMFRATRAVSPRVLVVSHFYHLPRIKLTYRRYGFDVQTVPARIDQVTPDLLYNTAREIPALWTYYLRGLRSTT